MDIANAQGTPLAVAGIVIGALSFLVIMGIVFKGSIHF